MQPLVRAMGCAWHRCRNKSVLQTRPVKNVRQGQVGYLAIKFIECDV